jgi:VWFA-related protein
MKPGIRLILAVLAGTSCVSAQSPQAPGPATAPQTPASQNRQAPIIIRTENVIVPVTIKDKSGQLVGDLQKGDFRIFADGIEQKILSFSANPAPLSAVVVIDDDLEQKQAAEVQSSLSVISAAFGANDEVAVVTYDEFPKTVFDFSFNNDALYTQLKRIELASHSVSVNNGPSNAGPVVNGQQLPTGTGLPLHGSGRYVKKSSLNDALYSAGDLLKDRGRDRRKIIFLVSDMTNTENRHTFEETLHALLINDISVYSVSVVHALPVGKKLVQDGASQVFRYANDTGGDTFYASKQDDLDQLYADVTEEARNEYVLTFSPQDVDRSKDYHPIEVRVERPNLNIVTRQGYYQSAIAAGH